MKTYYSKSEFENIVPTTLSEIPINPKTGKPYHEGTKTWWRWYYGLTEYEQGILADLEA